MKAENQDLLSETMELQMGPSHPATHGTIKFNLKLEGEKVLECDVEVGYLHRCSTMSATPWQWRNSSAHKRRRVVNISASSSASCRGFTIISPAAAWRRRSWARSPLVYT